MTYNPHEKEIRARFAKVRAAFPSIPEHLVETHIAQGLTADAAAAALLRYIGDNDETRADAIYSSRAKARALQFGRAS